jgi:hypothetical protein
MHPVCPCKKMKSFFRILKVVSIGKNPLMADQVFYPRVTNKMLVVSCPLTAVIRHSTRPSRRIRAPITTNRGLSPVLADQEYCSSLSRPQVTSKDSYSATSKEITTRKQTFQSGSNPEVSLIISFIKSFITKINSEAFDDTKERLDLQQIFFLKSAT